MSPLGRVDLRHKCDEVQKRRAVEGQHRTGAVLGVAHVHEIGFFLESDLHTVASTASGTRPPVEFTPVSHCASRMHQEESARGTPARRARSWPPRGCRWAPRSGRKPRRWSQPVTYSTRNSARRINAVSQAADTSP